MVYCPGLKYVAEGFCKKEIVALPRSHFHCVGLPVERSVKFTTSGEQPDTGLAVNLAASCALEVNPSKTDSAIMMPVLTAYGAAIGFLL